MHRQFIGTLALAGLLAVAAAIGFLFGYAAASRSAVVIPTSDIEDRASLGASSGSGTPPPSAAPLASLLTPSPPVTDRAGGGEETADPNPSAALERATYQGIASWVAPRYGARYLALREPRGTRARICGAGGCVTRRSTDYGPALRERVADLSAADFAAVCGVPRSLGLCPVTVTIEARP